MVTTTGPVVAVPEGPTWAQAAAESLTDTLAAHPIVAGWLAPHRAVQPLIGDLTLLVQHAVQCGGALMLEDRTGLIAWCAAPDRLPRVAATRRMVVDDGYARRWANLEDLLRSTVPAGSGGHLMLLLAAAGAGVSAARRADVLLTSYHRHLDAAAAVAHTAAFDAALVRLLHQRGWTPGSQRSLPDGAPWWPVHRHPRNKTR